MKKNNVLAGRCSRFIKQALFACALLLSVSSVAQDADINRVWIDTDVTQGDELGITVHVDFSVDGMLGQTIRCVAFFYDMELKAMPSTAEGYMTTSDNLCVSDKDQSIYESCRWTDFPLFVPYKVMNLYSEPQVLHCLVCVRDNAGNTMAMSGYEFFIVDPQTLVKRQPNGVTSYTTRHGDGTATIRNESWCKVCSGLGTCSACYGRGGRPIGYNWHTCYSCKGRAVCQSCNGTGKFTTSFTTNRSMDHGRLVKIYNYALECYNSENYSKAFAIFNSLWFTKNSGVQNMLGVCYKTGHGVDKDYAAAIRWYRLAVAQGDDAAQSNLGRCYRDGEGVAQDYYEAARLFRLSAEQGCDAGQYHLGLCYEDGEGVAQDYNEALRLYRLASAQGYAAASLRLGYCYVYGVGVAKDYDEAERWYRLALEQGSEMAESMLKLLQQMRTANL